MDSDNIQDKPSSVENVSYGDLEAESNNIDSLEAESSGGGTVRELESVAEILTRVELDIACSSEKLINMDTLVMHVASRETDFEAFSLEEDHILEGPFVKALEFDLLYGLLDSEVRELERFLSALHTEIASSRETVSSFTHLGEPFSHIEDKLLDCEDSLKKNFEQVLDITKQSANFQRILSTSSGDDKWKENKEVGCSENYSSPNLSAKTMHTAEQQRIVLRMLEKSLAREMDLDQKLIASRDTEEELKFRLQQEEFFMEQEAEYMWERLFEAENSAEILFGVTKELLARIQMAQFSTNGRIRREVDLRSKLEDVSEQNKELTEKASEAEKRAEIAEAECKMLRKSHMELNTNTIIGLKSGISDATNHLEQLESELKDSEIKRIHATNHVEQMESKLKDSEIKRIHAVASAEASQEKLIMLDCTIKDMDNLIKDLKSKVLRAESQTDSAEDKCIILSESNAELIDEINFLRRRVEDLETSLHQADEAKKETAKDIRVRTELITDLVLQLALERERLHKQISSLTKEKKLSVKFLQHVNGPSDSATKSKVEEVKVCNNDSENKCNEQKTGSSATCFETGNGDRDWSKTGTNTRQDGLVSEAESVRNIDARQLNVKYVLAVVMLVIPPLAAFIFSQLGTFSE